MQQVEKMRQGVFWRSFTSLVLCLMIVVLSLSGCSSTKVIVNGLDEREANEILVFLASKNIPAIKIQAKGDAGGGGSKMVLWDISVDAEKATEAMALLSMYGLPRKRGQNLLGIFSKGGLVPSELEEKIKYEFGLAEQIANTIRKIDGVLDSEVQISFPTDNPLNPTEQKGKVTASVYVKHTGVLDDPNLQMVPKIKRLVSSGVPALDYDNVTVITDRARLAEPSLTKPEHQQELVSIWSIIVARQSVGRFQGIFIAFFALVILCLIFTIWMIWKMSPILQKGGGYKQLFTLKALQVDDLIAAKEKADSEAKAKEAEKAEQEAKAEEQGAEGGTDAEAGPDETDKGA